MASFTSQPSMLTSPALSRRNKLAVINSMMNSACGSAVELRLRTIRCCWERAVSKPESVGSLAHSAGGD
jgi:hypothetical protein